MNNEKKIIKDIFNAIKNINLCLEDASKRPKIKK